MGGQSLVASELKMAQVPNCPNGLSWISGGPKDNMLQIVWMRSQGYTVLSNTHGQNKKYSSASVTYWMVSREDQRKIES